MRACLIAAFLSTSLLAQSGTVGVFSGAGDIGGPPLNGSARYDAAGGQYTITGTGTDIWGQADQFHYVWREMSGNFSIGATVRFLTGGHPHRKAVLMARRSTAADSPFVHLAIHGDGMAAVQFRSQPGAATSTLDFPAGAAGVWKLKMTRQGSNFVVFTAPEGEPLRELGHTVNAIGSPVLVGLGVASHDQKALNTVVFSDVTVEAIPTPARGAPPAPAPVAPAR